MLWWEQGAESSGEAGLHQASQGSESTRVLCILFPKSISRPFSKSISRVFACETSPLLCQQLEGVNLPGLRFQDGSSCFHITQMYIFSAFEYRRHLGEPFHLRNEVLQVGRLRRRLVKAGRARSMGPACPPPRCLARRGAGGQAVETIRLQGRLLAAAPRDAFTVRSS